MRTPQQDIKDSLVWVEDLHLSLVGGAGEVKILQGINLAVEAGETVSITGTSGAGKTTLLMALAGLEKGERGRVRIAGVDLHDLNEDALARFRQQHVGIVFQAFHLIATMTALENVALPLEFAGFDSAFAQAEQALNLTGLGRRLGHFPGELSGGEQQRVALARAIVARPPLVLADEPTGNLDQDTGTQVMDLLFDLQQEIGTTLILVTHDEQLAQRCQRRIRMSDGLLLTAGQGAA